MKQLKSMLKYLRHLKILCVTKLYTNITSRQWDISVTPQKVSEIKWTKNAEFYLIKKRLFFIRGHRWYS